jgi:hypothetical protein
VWNGLLGSVVAGLIVAPWGFHIWRSGEGIALNDRGVFALLLEDGTKYLGDNPVVFGDPGLDPEDRRRGIDVHDRRERELVTAHPGFDSLPNHMKNRLRRDWMIDFYLEFPGGTYVFARAVLLSWARVLLPGGEGEWHRLLGMELQPDKAPAVFYGVKAAALGVTLFERLLATVGLVALLSRRQFAMVLLIFGWIALFTGLTGLVGNTRYRLPSELPLALLAGAGWVWLGSWLTDRRRPDRHPATLA